MAAELLGAGAWRCPARFPPSSELCADPEPHHAMTQTILFGIDRLFADPDLCRPLAGRRVALLAHPASVTADLTHSLTPLAARPDIRLTAAFGPQHGI